jgi:Lar family restriction alleviation protein
MSSPAIGLKPCPFCGSDAAELTTAMGETWARCHSCSASAAASSHPALAIGNWNARAGSAQSQSSPEAAHRLADQLQTYADRYRSDWSDATPILSWEDLAVVIDALRRCSAQPQPFGYLIKKTGVNNGYYWISPAEFEHVEERFRYLYKPIYEAPVALQDSTHPVIEIVDDDKFNSDPDVRRFNAAKKMTSLYRCRHCDGALGSHSATCPVARPEHEPS